VIPINVRNKSSIMIINEMDLIGCIIIELS